MRKYSVSLGVDALSVSLGVSVSFEADALSTIDASSSTQSHLELIHCQLIRCLLELGFTCQDVLSLTWDWQILHFSSLFELID
jgi:hypothetical protein